MKFDDTGKGRDDDDFKLPIAVVIYTEITNEIETKGKFNTWSS